MPSPVPMTTQPAYSSIAHLVAIRPGALGDTLLSLPALALARRRWPQAKITFVARGDAAQLAQASGIIDDLSPYDASQWQALFAENPAPTGPAHELLRGCSVVAWLTDEDGLVQHNLRRLGAEHAIIAPGKPAPGHLEHMALMLARGLASYGLEVPTNREVLAATMLPLRASSGEVEAIEAFWQSASLDGRRVVALHVGSGGAAKRWPPQAFALFIRELATHGFAPLLIVGPQDEAVTQAVIASAALPDLAVAQNLALGEVTVLLQRCVAYVGNDTGVTHLAALAGIPTLALFGPSDPGYWSPIGRQVTLLLSPTSEMADIPVTAVWQALHTMLATAI